MTLTDTLQRWVTHAGPPVVVRPDRPAALREVLHALRAAGAVVGREVTVDRSAFDHVGALNDVSLLVDVGAGVSLQSLEARAASRGLSLGPLWPGAAQCALGEMLEGPWAGLRAVPGGRLEPMCTSLSGITPQGHLVSTPAGPRNAMGPDLRALFLGAQGRSGWVIDARVQLVPAAQGRLLHCAWVDSPQAVIAALRCLLLEGPVIARVLVTRVDQRLRLQVELESHPSLAARDQRLLAAVLPARDIGPAVEVARASAVVERAWPAVRHQLEAAPSVELYRLSLETVLVGTTAVEARTRWALHHAVARAVDPSGTCSGEGS